MLCIKCFVNKISNIEIKNKKVLKCNECYIKELDESLIKNEQDLLDITKAKLLLISKETLVANNIKLLKEEKETFLNQINSKKTNNTMDLIDFTDTETENINNIELINNNENKNDPLLKLTSYKLRQICENNNLSFKKNMSKSELTDVIRKNIAENNINKILETIDKPLVKEESKDINLTKYTIAKLMQLCDYFNVTHKKKISKNDLIEIITNNVTMFNISKVISESENKKYYIKITHFSSNIVDHKYFSDTDPMYKKGDLCKCKQIIGEYIVNNNIL